MADLSDIIEALEKLLSHPNDTNPAVWSAAWFDATEPGKVRLLLDALKREPVKVKALEWNERKFAHTGSGVYYRVQFMEGCHVLTVFDGGEWKSVHDTDESARAHAQADYERRIRSALEPASSPPATEAPEGAKPQWWLSEAWSARMRDDGRLEPAVKISGTGVSYQESSSRPGSLEMQRFWLEEYGRIEKGAPYFYIDAPFVLASSPPPGENAP